MLVQIAVILVRRLLQFREVLRLLIRQTAGQWCSARGANRAGLRNRMDVFDDLLTLGFQHTGDIVAVLQHLGGVADQRIPDRLVPRGANRQPDPHLNFGRLLPDLLQCDRGVG